MNYRSQEKLRLRMNKYRKYVAKRDREKNMMLDVLLAQHKASNKSIFEEPDEWMNKPIDHLTRKDIAAFQQEYLQQPIFEGLHGS